MKKLIIGLALLGGLSFATPKVADAACATVNIQCCGSGHYIVVCDGATLAQFYDIVCNC